MYCKNLIVSTLVPIVAGMEVLGLRRGHVIIHPVVYSQGRLTLQVEATMLKPPVPPCSEVDYYKIVCNSVFISVIV